MPGVPTSRGCDVCRKQKKKCDQSKPACSRCRRLQVPCEGSGKQRFMFKEQQITRKPAQTQRAQQTAEPNFLDFFIVNPISQNPTSRTTGALISTLEVTDPRYDISCYGIFLKDIPRRLGQSEALDASVTALTAAFPTLHIRSTPPEVLSKYGQSLKALRNCMSDPTRAHTTDTLCAIYLTMICQMWIGRDDGRTVHHAEAMAHILNALALKGLKDRFELEMFVMVAVIVIMEKVFNPRIQLSPEVLAMNLHAPYGHEEFFGGDDGTLIHSLSLKNLADIPEFIQHPDLHLSEIESTYKSYRIDIYKLRRRLHKLESTFTSGSAPVDMIRLHSAIQTAYILVNFMALVLNLILVGYGSQEIVLFEEAATLADEIMTVAKLLLQRRPLGASHGRMCLTAVWAWASVNNSDKQEEVEKIWAEHQENHSHVLRWRDVAIWIKFMHERVSPSISPPLTRRHSSL